MSNTDKALDIVRDSLELRDTMRHGDNPRQRLLAFRLNDLLPELIAIADLVRESEEL